MAWDVPVSHRLMEFVAASSAATLTAFDADGTIWSEDVGEAFLRWAGENGKLKRWPKGDAAWTQYQMRLGSGNLRRAFEFCVTAFAEMPDEEVAKLAHSFVSPRWRDYIFPEMRSLIATLTMREVEVWIISGSPAWCVIPGAALVGVPPERVIAARPEVAGGLVTERLAGPLPFAETKPEALVSLAGRAPHLAAGNSEYDYPMLESARALSLLINPPPGDGWHDRRGGRSWLVQRWER